MAYATSEFSLPADATPASDVPNAALSLGASVASYFRKRWTYRTILAELEGYSARNLEDFGVDCGLEEFARRAAGL